MKRVFILVVPVIYFLIACSTSKNNTGDANEIRIVKNDALKTIDISISGKPFTSLTWPDSIFKPVLYPIVNAAGTEITRGYPLRPRADERTDHPHHVGMWLNYGNVNGLDFWGNSYDIPEATRKKSGGNIKFLRAENIVDGKSNASMTIYNSWEDPQGKEVLYEKTTFDFVSNDSIRIIDRITTLTATTGNVTMPDTKEGMFAIRVARQLELPSKETVVLSDAQNNQTTVPQMANDSVGGNYLSSEGIKGDSVWGTRARWMNLYGVIAQDSLSVVIVDHPKNPGYPSYWHARGYGLFAVNPLGVKDFSEGRETMNFSIPANQSATFRYRVVITSRKQLTPAEINSFADDFAKKY